MFFVVLATLWLFACKKEDGKKVEFHALPFSSIVSDTLEIDSVRMNTFFSNPTSLFTIDDSLILVFDDNRSDKLCHFIHTKGYVVKSFGEWGRARGEFILPQGLSLSKDKEACCVYDYNTQYTVCFSVKEALGGGNPVQDVIRMEEVESERPVEHRWLYQATVSLDLVTILGIGFKSLINQRCLPHIRISRFWTKKKRTTGRFGVIWRLLVYLLTKNILS